MKKSVPMMPWFPRDYICATRHFSLAERGAYTDLLFIQWDMGPLPNDPVRLARLLGCTPEEFAQVWEAIRDKFEDCLDGTGNLVNRRAESEKKKYVAYRQRQSGNAKKGVDERWPAKRLTTNVVDITGKTNSQIRSERLAAARRIATHTDAEWRALVIVCGSACVRCGIPATELVGGVLTKDHILPLYAGGSDGIGNLQPLCRRCNASKGPDASDLRSADWEERLSAVLAVPQNG